MKQLARILFVCFFVVINTAPAWANNKQVAIATDNFINALLKDDYQAIYKFNWSAQSRLEIIKKDSPKFLLKEEIEKDYAQWKEVDLGPGQNKVKSFLVPGVKVKIIEIQRASSMAYEVYFSVSYSNPETSPLTNYGNDRLRYGVYRVTAYPGRKGITFNQYPESIGKDVYWDQPSTPKEASEKGDNLKQE